MNPEIVVALNAVDATTTSQPVDIKGAKRISWVFTRTNHSAGSSAFAVEVTIDGSNWVTFSKLISNVTNTNAQTLTRVASVSLATNTSTLVSMDIKNDSFSQMRVTATETTDGNHTAKARIEYVF